MREADVTQRHKHPIIILKNYKRIRSGSLYLSKGLLFLDGGLHGKICALLWALPVALHLSVKNEFLGLKLIVWIDGSE